jgi:hypothetical protein
MGRGPADPWLKTYFDWAALSQADLLLTSHSGYGQTAAWAGGVPHFTGANPSFNVLLVHDTNCEAEFCVDKAMIEHEKRGTIRVLQSYGGKKSGYAFFMGVTVAESSVSSTVPSVSRGFKHTK